MFTRPTKCPNQKCRFRDGPNGSERLYGSTRFWIKRGHYRTKHDHRAVPRYSCRACGRYFNSRTGTPTAGQHKPHVNRQVFGMLCSGMTQRRTADWNRKKNRRAQVPLAGLQRGGGACGGAARR